LGIKTELRKQGPLADDFPEVCYPIYRLEGINQRAKGQLCNGQPTHIEWSDSQVILPTIDDQPGCIIAAGGLLSAVRGAQHTAADGSIWRPSFVVIDDPQTRESANSADQVETRLDIINGDVLGMAGPGEPIAVAVPCTIIRTGDVADVLTDREKSPDWRGQRAGIVDKLPDDLKLWEDYFEILDRIKDVDDEEDDTVQVLRAEATAFYVAHQAAMDAGCTATWPARFLAWEASAIQHAMNLYHRSESAFWSEYMNSPLDPFAAAEEFLAADEIAIRFSGYTRETVPLDGQILTFGTDVQHRCLYWVVLATDMQFTCQIVDYGCFPEQQRKSWKATKAEHTLKAKYPGTSLEGAIYSGVRELHNDLMTRKFKRVDDQTMYIQLGLTDANDKTSVVKKAIRESDHAARLLASHGKYYGPNMTQISGFKAKTGERIGDEWLIRPGRGKSGRHVIFDTDHWKMFTQRRLATPPGDRGSLTIYGRQRQRPHSFLARHLTAEYIQRQGGNRSVDHWTMKPGESENHWLDALVMAMVAASMCGAQITGLARKKTNSRRSRSAEYFS
ncbi:MAG: terminase gpA endonuclease subunit, partial [Planctomycetaceae bacterium]